MTETSKVMTERIVYSGWDFQQALSALTFLLDECDFEQEYNYVDLRRFRCFETAMIVAFSRPFKVGRGRRPFDLEVIGFEMSTAEIGLKKKILYLRDKSVSHSDEEEMEFLISSIRPCDDHGVRMPLERFQEGLQFDERELREIEGLIREILRAIAIFKFDFVQANPDEFDRIKSKKP
ncbi:hypothetical protein QLQ86_17030 [Halomonas sp. LR5S13]|uniref:hypothetical protein n=1 Tax=Halomonas rhizosphaerae TaxID=3043296 RepID=UPI0024A85BA5|nr:hypothetical protein [Halomonas rhizosphaerae]MDI5922489.1 hypothetical protein [Halomonas rhizosphaerae]